MKAGKMHAGQEGAGDEAQQRHLVAKLWNWQSSEKEKNKPSEPRLHIVRPGYVLQGAGHRLINKPNTQQ